MKTRFCRYSLVTTLCVALFSGFARPSGNDFQITWPRPNTAVAGEVITLQGVGADPTGTLEVEVVTNQPYLQDGEARINEDGSWTFSPVHLGGQGRYNFHTIRVSILRNGRRVKTVTVTGIVRR